MHSSLWLTFLLVVPLAGSLGAALTRKVEGRAYMVAIGASTIELVLSVIVAFLYNDHIAKAQTFDFATRHVLAASFGLAYDVSIDGISLLMVVLTALTVLLALRSSHSSVPHHTHCLASEPLSHSATRRPTPS